MTKTPIEPGDIRKGDTISETYSSGHLINSDYVALHDRHTINRQNANAWSLLARPKPAVVLPTEPGVYVDKVGDLWVIGELPELVCLTSGGHDELERLDDGADFYPGNFAPFTKLEPVAQIAERVLDAAMLTMRPTGFMGIAGVVNKFKALAEEFGVVKK